MFTNHHTSYHSTNICHEVTKGMPRRYNKPSEAVLGRVGGGWDEVVVELASEIIEDLLAWSISSHGVPCLGKEGIDGDDER